MGIELTTYSLGSCRSTTELRPRALSYRAEIGSPRNGYAARKCLESLRPCAW